MAHLTGVGAYREQTKNKYQVKNGQQAKNLLTLPNRPLLLSGRKRIGPATSDKPGRAMKT